MCSGVGLPKQLISFLAPGHGIMLISLLFFAFTARKLRNKFESHLHQVAQFIFCILAPFLVPYFPPCVSSFTCHPLPFLKFFWFFGCNNRGDDLAYVLHSATTENRTSPGCPRSRAEDQRDCFGDQGGSLRGALGDQMVMDVLDPLKDKL